MTAITDIEAVAPVANAYACETCGKSFPNKRGLVGHESSHIQARCSTCGKTFSQSGIGSHRRSCVPSRKPGRPRHPIAEPLDRRKAASHNPDVEVPDLMVLDDLEEDFPSPDAFTFAPTVESEEPVMPTVVVNSEDEALLNAFFPDRLLSPVQLAEFRVWVKVTRSLFDAMYDTF